MQIIELIKVVNRIVSTLCRMYCVYYFQLENSIRRISNALPAVLELAQGGTAVGTGLNAKAGFAEKVVV